MLTRKYSKTWGGEVTVQKRYKIVHLTVLPCSLNIFTMSAIGYWALAAHKPQPKQKK